MPTTTNGHTPIPSYPLHELAHTFPGMTPAEYEGLKADIAAHGVHQAIVIWRGAVVDGRHRYQAAQELGLNAEAVPFRILDDDDDAEAIVWSSNMMRRQLLDGQKGIIAARWTKIRQGENGIEHQTAGKPDGFPKNGHSKEARANRAGISATSLLRADAIFDWGNQTGNQALIDSVFLGKVTLADAYKAVMLEKRSMADAEAAAARAEEAAARAEEARRTAERAAERARQDAAALEASAEAAARAFQESQAAERATEQSERVRQRAELTSSVVRRAAADTVQRREAETKPKVERGVMRTALAEVNAIERQKLAENPPELPVGIYRTVVIDPPWPMAKIPREVRPNQVGFDYPTMSLEEIGALDIGARLADDSFCFLWTTQKFLPVAFDIMAGWGLDYRFTMVWHKPGGIQIYNYPQYNCEFIIVGSKGSPDFVDTKAFNTAFKADRQGHSVKPDEFYDLLRRVTAGPRLDMFSRRNIDGFEVWGNQA